MDLNKFVRRKKRYFSLMRATLLLIVILGLGLLVTYHNLQKFVVDSCYTQLAESTDAQGENLKLILSKNQQHMQTMAMLLARLDDLRGHNAAVILNSYGSSGIIKSLNLLFPDNTVLKPDGTVLDVQGQLNFGLLSKRSFISDKSFDVENGSLEVIRIFVPVLKNGRTEALLYGLIDLKQLSDYFKMSIYGGQARLFLIDGDTGEMLLNTWDKNLNSIDFLRGQKGNADQGPDQIFSDILAGHDGDATYYADDMAGELYMHYQPAGINNWQLALAVPKAEVFKEAGKMQGQLEILAVVYIIIFLLYGFWVLRILMRDAQTRELQLQETEFRNKMEQTLFDFHLNEKRMDWALRYMSRNFDAQLVFLLVLEQGELHTAYASDKDHSADRQSLTSLFQDACPQWYQHLKMRRNVVTEASNIPGLSKKFMEQNALNNLYLMPVFDAAGHMRGILGLGNCELTARELKLLPMLAWRLASALDSRRIYCQVEQMGTTDYNTGLLNRNSFLIFADKWRRGEKSAGAFTCIYMDANGLHELNNREGHAAGDRMLKAVADAMKMTFPDGLNYRIGGDEFLTLLYDKNEAAAAEATYKMTQRLSVHGYHVAAGLAHEAEDADLDKMIKTADVRMLAAKKHYYETIGDRRQSRK